MKIITLTLNPAFDVHYHIDDFKPFHENLATVTAFEAGGKGVNISRALTFCGVENVPLVVLGDENGDTFRSSVARDGMTMREIVLPGRIRENVTIHTDTADETRISFAGFKASPDLLDRVEAILKDEMRGEDVIVTFTGRVASGMDMKEVKAFLRRLRDAGAKIVIDSKSFTVSDLAEVGPWLIKPNQEEISEYLNVAIDSFEDALGGARELVHRGIENVMVSLGGKGAMLVRAHEAYIAHAPRVKVLSTIGAGDSSIAGFCAAAKAGKDARGMLATAVAYGSAACMTEGTRPPMKADMENLLAQVTVENL